LFVSQCPNPEVTLPSLVQDPWAWLVARPFHHKLLLAAALVVLVELALRRLAPKSAAYAAWTRFFQGIGHVWTAVILALIYFLSVSLVSAFLKLRGQDPLDRSLAAEPSFWREHDPGPLDPRAAVRHLF
jgi:hypothetical protein